MSPVHKLCLISLAAFVALCSSGCLMQRTVTEGGQTVSKKYVVERPIRDAIRDEHQ